jgi:hypothetical protein
LLFLWLHVVKQAIEFSLRSCLRTSFVCEPPPPIGITGFGRLRNETTLLRAPLPSRERSSEERREPHINYGRTFITLTTRTLVPSTSSLWRLFFIFIPPSPPPRAPLPPPKGAFPPITRMFRGGPGVLRGERGG